MTDRWTVRLCPEHGLLTRSLRSGLGPEKCPICWRYVGDEFEVMRVPDLEGAGQARRTDPSTAKAAAEIKVSRGSQRWKVLEAITEVGAHGATSHELEELTGIRYASLTPRIGELKRGRLIVATDRTRKGRYGVEQEVLVLAQNAAPREGPGGGAAADGEHESLPRSADGADVAGASVRESGDDRTGAGNHQQLLWGDL